MPRRSAARPVPITSFPGLELDPAISPTGDLVAFAWDGENEDNFDIYVRSIVRQLTVAADDGCRGRPYARVVARRSTDCVRASPSKGTTNVMEGEVIVMPAFGGPEQRLFEASRNGCRYGGPVARALVDAGRQAPGLWRSERHWSQRRRSTCTRSRMVGDAS